MKRIGIREIAGLAGVSIGTVDRALHGRARINEETRERIPGDPKKLAPVINEAEGRGVRVVCVANRFA